MSFTQPAFIRKNTPELRKKLRNMGYKVFPDLFSSPCISCLGTTAFPSSEDNPDRGIDCGENEELFIALAALRDDSDFLQWFVWGNRWMLWKHDCSPQRMWTTNGISNVFTRGHKATVEEIIKHFKTEGL